MKLIIILLTKSNNKHTKHKNNNLSLSQKKVTINLITQSSKDIQKGKSNQLSPLYQLQTQKEGQWIFSCREETTFPHKKNIHL